MDGAGRPRVTEQVRDFLRRRASQAGTDDCVLPAGVYVVGPGHHLMLRRVGRPVKFDPFPVTVARYKRFLEAVTRHGSAPWDHPGMPAVSPTGGLHPADRAARRRWVLALVLALTDNLARRRAARDRGRWRVRPPGAADPGRSVVMARSVLRTC